MTRKFILLLIIFIFTIFCKGNELKLTFNPAITSSKDTSVKAIAHLWKNYLNARHHDKVNSLRNPQHKRQIDSIQNLYWYNNAEDLQGGEVYERFYILIGEFSTFSIRKYSETVYEIHTLVQAKAFEGEGMNTLLIYKVCATKTDEGFKLQNYFDVYKSALRSYTSENVEFYYPCEYNFDVEKAKDTEEFIRQFRKDYGIKKTDQKIICVVGNSISESNAFVGFDFTIVSSENKFAGYFLEPSTILTCRQDHIHEFAHVLLKCSYIDVFDIVNEGIATYYGGTAGSGYIFHCKNLQKYLTNNPVDFSDSSSLWEITIEDACLAYVVGALIVDYTLKNYGAQKVIELFSCKDYEDIFSKLEVSKEDINDFVYRLVADKK